MPDTILARIKPFNPRRGCTLKTYSVHGSLFRVEKGWQPVDDELANYLRGVRQHPEDPTSQLAFDVCTRAEADRMDNAARIAADPRAAAADVPIRAYHPSRADAARAAAATGTLTTADLPANQRADTTDALPGSEADLDADDLAAAPPKAAPAPASPSGVPGAPRSFSPRARARVTPPGGS
jgi:hypothetical protein